MSQQAGYCQKCGAQLQAGSSFCPKCGAPVSAQAAPTDWREQRRQMREQRRAQRSGFGGLVIATLLILLGIGIFLPNLPWQFLWGAILILLGLWIAFAWFRRGSVRARTQAQPAP